MKPAPFTYHRADTLEHAVDLLVEHGDDGKLLAGGQSLVPMMNLRLARPRALVDLAFVRGLAGIEPTASGGLRIGAMTRHAAVEHHPAPLEGFDALPVAATHIGHPPIRMWGTFGGSLAHADPVAEWSVLCVFHDAVAELFGPAGTRHRAITDVLRGPFMTDLAVDEILTAVVLTAPFSSSVFHEVASQHGDFALAAVAAGVDVRHGVVGRARVVVGGVTPVPVELPGIDDMLAGMPVTEVRVPDLDQGVRAGILEIAEDPGAPVTSIAGALARRTLVEAVEKGRQADA